MFETQLLAPDTLHIPDGFLSVPVAVIFWLLTAVVIGIAVRKSGGESAEKQAPLMGIMAAFIFAGQMINFPVIAGTSGHLLGGTLAAVTLGPWGGILVMSTVVGVQALIFQDGGLLALGANIFNMGILTVIIGYGLYRSVAGITGRSRSLIIGLAAWLTVFAGALLTSLQLWLSGIASLAIVLPVMLLVHALIGIGEALITVAAVSFIMRTRPDILTQERSPGSRSWIAVGLLLSLVVVLLAPFASANPDGLERVAINLGFIDEAGSAPFKVLPDYTIEVLGSSGLSTVAAGLIGIGIVSLLTVGLAALMRQRSRRG